MNLTHAETRSLLCKYFQKVIDLREGAKKMEQQFAELEVSVKRIKYVFRELLFFRNSRHAAVIGNGVV